MLRIQPIESASQAETYYSKSDAGYYEKPDDLRCAWVGKGAELLGLEGPPDYEQFKRLIHGLDPHSGSQLTSKLLDNRLAGWDVNVHCPKGVTMVIEQGDERVQDALWEAARETVADLEKYATTRVRKGGKQEDRVTGNLVGYAVEHAETRPAKDDKMPDPHRHIHMVIANLTYDKVEGEFKAVKFRAIMDLRKFLDRRFNQRLSSKLAGLGYQVETKWERGAKGERKYMGWDIGGMPATAIRKFSRRTAEIDKLAEELGVTSAVAKDRLGATSRLTKRKDLTLDDCREYWQGKLVPAEAKRIDDTIAEAIAGEHPLPEPGAKKAMQYAIGHHFERQSVIPLKQLEIAAMERSMGASLPEDIEREAKSQGLLVRDGQATTKDVLAEERRVIGFARNGRGCCRPMGPAVEADVPGFHELSKQQQAAVRHVWQSTDKLVLIRGAAGTGKTRMMSAAIGGIDKPVVVLAPSANASRDVLRGEGFGEADTIARFLVDESFRDKARNGVIWVDEAGLAGMRQLDSLLGFARELKARVVLQGDPKQHAAVERGSPLYVLEHLAGVPVATLTDIRRQHGRYKEAVAAIDRGDILEGHDILAELGWVQQTPVFDHNLPLVEDYLEAIRTRKPDGNMTTALIVSPTHVETDEITSDLRRRLKLEGILGDDEREFAQLKPLHWTEAERGDPAQFLGSEIVQFHRNSGQFKAGQRVEAMNLLNADKKANPAHFAAYSPSTICLAPGDAVRITASGGKSKDGKHKLNNGAMYTIKEFTEAGDIRLSNNWIISKSFGTIAHAYAITGHAAQGKTVDRVFIALGRESQPAINMAAYYVAVSRGRNMAKIYTDLSRPMLREAIQKSQPRLSATELIARPTIGLRKRAQRFVQRVRGLYRQWHDKAQQFVMPTLHAPEVSYGR